MIFLLHVKMEHYAVGRIFLSLKLGDYLIRLFFFEGVFSSKVMAMFALVFANREKKLKSEWRSIMKPRRVLCETSFKCLKSYQLFSIFFPATKQT